ncbi:hypothetical protein JHK84_047859 [Glycine max]|uniref:Uncharacterized protein n=1 Tax=Glycine soja TaxID=3848 RepID=A0A445G8F2_GLYSO|nr:hypothetical protein JHK86_047836 [Glycine max]KAG4933631.1 hypothetical protein JHK87_047633 [Glycine soja]KAG4943803.1 hypothetical protein JHK85_048449 [Glycine max]KAG5102890.1 hypothetical protein JHK84_047859 [Glycine max]RZB57448.1 hypothetical protein D0Y65_046206 [Glycine soja]
MLYYCSWVCDNQEGLGSEYTSQPTAYETSRPDLLSGPHVPAKVTKLWLSILR